VNLRQFTLLALTVICGSLVSGLYAITRDQINSNREQFEQRQLHAVINDDTVTVTKVDQAHYLFSNEHGAAGSVALVTTHAGYNGKITLWVATNVAGDVRGVRIAAHQETPGIGDIIERDVSEWIDQFEASAKQVDSVSGATITTRAVINAVRRHREDDLEDNMP